MYSISSLTQLPNELIVRVIDHVSPADIEPLALCNKTIRTLATKALERHEQLKKKYNTITLGDVDEYQYTNDNDRYYVFDERSLSLIADVFGDHDIAYYPAELSLGPDDIFDNPGNPSTLCNEDDLAKYQTLSSRVLPHWNDFISGFSLLREEEKGDWHHVLQTSDSKCAAMALLLILLPNIRHLTLKILWMPTWPSRIWTIVNRIAQTDVGTAFSKLRKITIDFEANARADNIQAFAAFAILPSIRWLDGVTVRGGQGWDNYSSFEWPDGSGKCSSKVKKVTFTKSSVHANALSSFLSGFAALEEFIYHHRAGLHGTYYQPEEYVPLLRHYAGTSLVKLDMTLDRYDIYGNPPRGHLHVDSLQGFSALKHIRVDDDLFELSMYSIRKRDDENRMERLVDVLPKSTVTLEILQHRDTAEASDLFKDLAELKEDRLPELREVSCWYPGEVFDSPLTGSLKESLEQVGIRTSTTPFSTTDIERNLSMTANASAVRRHRLIAKG